MDLQRRLSSGGGGGGGGAPPAPGGGPGGSGGVDRKFSSTTYMLEDEGLMRVQLSVNLVGWGDLGQYVCIGQNGYGSALGHVWLTGPSERETRQM